MKAIQGLNSDPKQQTTLTLSSGTQVSFYLEYKPQQRGWFFDVVIGDSFAVYGQRLVASPNILSQFRNKVAFGLAAFTQGDVEPTGQETFVDGTTQLFLLEATDVAVVAAVSAGIDPEGTEFVTWAQLRAYISGLPITGAAGGDLAGNYPDPTVAALHETAGPTRLALGAVTDGQFLKRVGTTLVGAAAPGGAVDSVNGATGVVVLNAASVGADAAGAAAAVLASSLQKSQNLGDLSDAIIARYNLGFRYVDLCDGPNALVGDGVTDNFSNFFYAQKKMEPDGGLTTILIAETGSGYTEGNYPLTIAGSGTGSGAAGKVVVSSNGRVISATVTAPGSGYHASARQVGSPGIVSGSPTITLNNVDATGISVGDSITHPSFPVGTTVIAKPTSMTLTASVNATASSNYSWIVFGLPVLTFSPGGGSGALLKPCVGRLIAKIRPGQYVGCPVELFCLHNTYFYCEGATFVATSKDADCIGIGAECVRLQIYDIAIQNFAELIYDPATRGTGIGFKVQGYDINFIRPRSTNIPNWNMSLGDAADGAGPYYGPMTVEGARFSDGSGDGIHLVNRVRKVTITNFTAINLGDDLLAIYPDDLGGAATQPPEDVVVCGMNGIGGGWRGIFIGGSSRRISISSVNLSSLSGYGIDITPGLTTTGPTDVSISAVNLGSIGHAGDGFRPYVGNRYPVNIDHAARVTITGLSFNNIEAGTLCFINNSTDCSIRLWNMLSKTAFGGAGNTNCSLVTS